jgi:hypothetical protein
MPTDSKTSHEHKTENKTLQAATTRRISAYEQERLYKLNMQGVDAPLSARAYSGSSQS